MIKSVKFRDLDKLPSKYRYAKKFITSGSIIEFSEGINLIVGKNGSGKSTLLNIIGTYLMCNEIMRSFVSSNGLSEIINSFTGEIYDGVDVEYDYRISAFKLSDDVSGNSINGEGYKDSLVFKSNSSGKSSGEFITYSMNYLSDLMNNRRFHKFDIGRYENLYEELALYKDYIDRNHYTPKVPRFSVLLDEPDKSLDMYGIEFLYKDLLTSSKNSQILVSLHNPVLIHKISKENEVNIIELSEGYVNYIDEFINSNTNK